MRLIRLAVLLALVLMPTSAELAAQSKPSAAAIAGCYRLILDTWSPPLRAQDWPASQTPPSEFQLDTTIVSLWLPRDTVWAVQPTVLVSRSRMPASWRYVGTDSVAIVWSTGFTGVDLRLQIVRDTLRGQARTFHDAHVEGEPPDPRTSAVAVRSRCAP